MSDSTQTLILGTAGHIDHGKTALVRALTGVDTDRLPEEKQRGMTIDIGFAQLNLGPFQLGIVDVPGHERFIRNMLAGAAGIDLALLVVAADDAVMPQTREHFEILKLLNVQHGLVAITKSDLGDDDLLEMVEQDVRQLVAGSFLEDKPFVQTSATTGQGIDELKAALTDVCQTIEPQSPGALFRLAVDRCFVVRGQGTVVTGSVASGTLTVGDQIEHLPAGETLRVRSLESHGRSVESVQRGQRAAVGLAGVHHRQITRGHELATIGYLKPTRLLAASVRLSPDAPWPVKHRARVRLHIGTGEVVATLALSRDNVLATGAAVTVQLVLAEPVAALCGQPFVLRSLSPVTTLGGGNVLQPLTRRIPRRDARKLARVESLASPDPLQRAAAAIYSYGLAPWCDLDLCRDARIDLDEAPAILEEFQTDGVLVDCPIAASRTLRAHHEIVDDFDTRILAATRRYHKANPLHVAMPRSALAQAVGLTEDEPLLTALVTRLAESHKVALHADAVALIDFTPNLSAQQQALLDRAVETYRSAAFQPPAPAELAKQHGVPEATLRQVIDLAVAQGQLKHLGGALYLHADTERDLRRRVGDKLQQTGGLTVSDIRTALDTSRKFAVPFCEYLDRIGLTRRRGDLRVLADRAAKVDPVQVEHRP